MEEELLSLISVIKDSEKFQDVKGKIETLCKGCEANRSRLLSANLKSMIFKKITQDWIENSYKEWKFFVSVCKIGHLEDSFSSLLAILSSPDDSNGFTLEYCIKLLAHLVEHLMTDLLSEINNQYYTNHLDTSIFHSVTNIVKAPTLVANIQKLKLITIFVPKNYFASVGNAVVNVIKNIIIEMQKGKDVTVKFLIGLQSRCCSLGYNEAINPLLNYFISNHNEPILWKIARKFICESGCVDIMVPKVLRQVDDFNILNVILADEISVNAELRNYLTHTMFFVRCFSEDSILRNAIGYLCSSALRRVYYQQVFLKLCKVWGSNNTINNISIEQQFYLSKAIMVCISFHDKHLDERLLSQVLLELTEGIHNHLLSEVEQIRKTAMVIGEAVSSRLIEDEKNLLKFTYEEDQLTNKLMSLLNLSSSHDEEPHLQNASKENCGDVKVDGTWNGKVEDGKSINDENITTKPVQSDDSDDFVPYDLSADVPLKSEKSPVYLKDCLDGLIQDKDVERNEECLLAVKRLMESNSYETFKMIDELSRALINLFPTQSLHSHKIDALIFLTVKFPEYMAGVLTKTFYDQNVTLTTRLEVLEIIRKAAGEISSMKFSGGTDDEEKYSSEDKIIPSDNLPCSSFIHKLFPKQEQVTEWKDVVEKRLEAKTRRFHTIVKKRPIQTQNTLGKFVESFFYPLINQCNVPREHLNMIEEPSLLGSLIVTLAYLCVYSQHTHVISSLAKELVDMIDFLSSHKDPFIRRCCLSSLVLITITLTPSTASDDLLCSLVKQIHWAAQIINDDVDYVCTDLAKQFVLAAQTLLKETTPELFALSVP